MKNKVFHHTSETWNTRPCETSKIWKTRPSTTRLKHGKQALPRYVWNTENKAFQYTSTIRTRPSTIRLKTGKQGFPWYIWKHGKQGLPRNVWNMENKAFHDTSETWKTKPSTIRLKYGKQGLPLYVWNIGNKGFHYTSETWNTRPPRYVWNSHTVRWLGRVRSFGIQTHKRFKIALHIRAKHNMQIWGKSPFFRLQKTTTLKQQLNGERWDVELWHLFAFGWAILLVWDVWVHTWSPRDESHSQLLHSRSKRESAKHK